MKLSEVLQERLDELIAKDEEILWKMVYSQVKPEDYLHHELWLGYWRKVGRQNHLEKERLKDEIMTEKNREVQVGDGVTICLYSDRHAATVIKRTKYTLTIQHDKATLKPSFKPEFVTGGFGAHCINNEDQEYDYERDENGQVETFRWNEKYGRWFRGRDQSIWLRLGRSEFYDYNF